MTTPIFEEKNHLSTKPLSLIFTNAKMSNAHFPHSRQSEIAQFPAAHTIYNIIKHELVILFVF
jgi:hypothetical protein